MTFIKTPFPDHFGFEGLPDTSLEDACGCASICILLDEGGAVGVCDQTCVLSASKDGTYARSELHLQTQGTSNFNPSAFPWKNIRGKISPRRNTHFRKTEFFKIKIFLKELYPQFQMRLKHKKKSGILETKREPKFLLLTFLYIIDNNWFVRP